MTWQKTQPWLLGSLALLLAACGGNGEPAPGASGGSVGTGGSNSGTSGANASGGSAASCKASFNATTANNYQFSSTITLTCRS